MRRSMRQRVLYSRHQTQLVTSYYESPHIWSGGFNLPIYITTYKSDFIPRGVSIAIKPKFQTHSGRIPQARKRRIKGHVTMIW
ncbi:hypothetical protein EYC80_008958 [Monilinia laxa]|uniref:Uncharacterized protein n=1 Tax=Monilinia laxa TaxID=61186 RepID=A0A5N6K1Y5_MONLA|nr:hypothetical protein EYC80_008958 [Monilinia laxa]